MKNEIQIILHALERDRRRIVPFLEVAFEEAGLDKKLEKQGRVNGDRPAVFSPGKISYWWSSNHLGESDERPYFEVIANPHIQGKPEFVYRGNGGDISSRFGIKEIGDIAPRIVEAIKSYVDKHPSN